jgi:hypothetical protein
MVIKDTTKGKIEGSKIHFAIYDHFTNFAEKKTEHNPSATMENSVLQLVLILFG